MIKKIENVLEQWECDKIIEYSKTRLIKSKVVDENSYGKSKKSNRRTNSHFEFIEPFDIELKGIREFIQIFISEKTNLPIENQETPVILNYKIGEEYKAHWDYFRKDNQYWNSVLDGGGQRLYSILIYLNDVEEGGETEYPQLDLKVKPELGTMLIHKNVEDDGTPIESSFHGALPPISGEKWALVCWVRENKWRKIDGV